MSEAASTRSPSDGASMRDRLIQAATQLLVDEGLPSVQARRIAREVGGTTMAVYHHFGGMPQLLAAVREEGFRQLYERLLTVPTTDDPIIDLYQLAMAYREAALARPNLYELMFGRSQATDPTPAGADQNYALMHAKVQRAIDLGRIRPTDPVAVTAQMTTLLHGYVALELAGHLSALDDSLEQVLIPLSRSLLVSLGDQPARIEESLAKTQGPAE
ncbi:TetR/AcrR family transcriptional regulator [Pseudonocardia spinosispora]|uniref:TetR/AcrR family transcriptional regulator n=1 Tax=Pseudonocardia spinosispora TaxID=103441 RepID=UPI000402B043|nr:WHG domain-containing protein [Pseudonocardia spinosispora]